MTHPAESLHYRTCNLCEAMCGLEITHRGDEIISIKGDKKDPFSKGFICPKAVALQDIYHDPDRLKKPIKKEGDQWVELEWEDAYDLVAEKLKAIQGKYGRNAVGVYQGNPNVHNLGSMLLASSFLRTLKTRNRYSATSADQLPHHLAAQEMLGHSLLMPVPDIDRTQYFLVMGANPIASNGSLMTAAGMPDRIKALKARGGKMVVVDPRKTETGERADRYVGIRPGKDVYFLAGLIREALVNGAVDLAKLPEWVKEKEGMKELFDAFTPQLVEKMSGVPANTLKEITREFTEASSAVCYGRMGLSTQEHGTLCQWLINVLNIITGNFDRAGGAMFATAAIDVVKYFAPKGTKHRYNRWQSRVRGLPETGGELPVATMSEEMLTPGEGQVKAFICVAGNPVLSTPNGTQLETALEGLEFMVSFDIYLNETSRHADIILPNATGLETEHYDLIFANFAVRDTAKYSPALFPKPAGARFDWEIFKALGKRMKKPTLFQRIFNYFLTPGFMLNRGLKSGPYKLSLAKLKSNPHGLDLGPLKPCLPQRLFTPYQTLILLPNLFVKGLKSLETIIPETESLTLIGRRHLRSNNSWMHNSHRLVKGPERCTVMIHPKDASERNIKQGDSVIITSRVGKISLPAELTETMMPGVVSIPHGYGHSRKGIRMKVASAHAGASINDLTDHMAIDSISGNAAFSGLGVDISPA